MRRRRSKLQIENVMSGDAGCQGGPLPRREEAVSSAK